MIATKERLTEALKQLAQKVAQVTSEGIKAGTIVSIESANRRRKLNTFQYGNKGIENLSYGWENVTRHYRPLDLRLLAELQSAPECSRASELAAGLFPDKFQVEQLNWFVTRAMRSCLDEVNPCDLDPIIKRFIADLSGEPAECAADVALSGLLLGANDFAIAPGVMIRRPRKEDLEIEVVEMFDGPYAGLTASPSAIARIEILGHRPVDIQQQVEKLVAILRLFRVGPVHYITYRPSSNAVAWMIGGTFGSNLRWLPGEPVTLTIDEIGKLQNFWSLISPVLPSQLYWPAHDGIFDERTVAYTRYSDALTRSIATEERIATAISGLEALLTRKESEVAYRLSMRAAKILSLLGEDAKKVRRAIKDAYDVRSRFAHGEHLPHAERNKLGTRYGSMEILLEQILGYLRKALIARLLSSETKEQLIARIDDSLVDSSSESKLRENIASARKAASL